METALKKNENIQTMVASSEQLPPLLSSRYGRSDNSGIGLWVIK